jgi:hypothetical protein
VDAPRPEGLVMSSPPTPPIPAANTANSDTEGLAFAAERALTGNRRVHFVTDRVQPPAALYVTSDDGLFCTVYNLAPGLTLNLVATLLLPDGRVQANAWNMALTATGSPQSFLFPLSEGYLINATITPTASSRYGQTWVVVSIRRGSITGGINLQTLISDYVDAYAGPTWPGSTIQHSISEPGLMLTAAAAANPVGQPFVLTVPTFARILLRSLFASYVTSAAVANRTVQLYLTDGSGNLVYADTAEATQAASLTDNYSWGLKSGFAQSALTSNYMNRSLPEVYLLPGATVNLTAINIQAGDQFRFLAMYYEQWFTF